MGLELIEADADGGGEDEAGAVDRGDGAGDAALLGAGDSERGAGGEAWPCKAEAGGGDREGEHHGVEIGGKRNAGGAGCCEQRAPAHELRWREIEQADDAPLGKERRAGTRHEGDGDEAGGCRAGEAHARRHAVDDEEADGLAGGGLEGACGKAEDHEGADARVADLHAVPAAGGGGFLGGHGGGAGGHAADGGHGGLGAPAGLRPGGGVVGQAPLEGEDDGEGDACEGEHGPCEFDDGEDEDGGDGWPQDGAEAEGGCEDGERACPFCRCGAAGDIGLGGGVGGGAEDAEQAAGDGEEAEGDERGDEALDSGEDDGGAEQHGDAEAGDAELHQAAAAPGVGLAGPIGGAERPEEGGEREDDGDRHVGDADGTADDGEDGLEGGVAGSGDEQCSENQCEMVSGERGDGRRGGGACHGTLLGLWARNCTPFEGA